MTTALFVVAAIAAASLCPALMWWNARRGRAAACSPPRRSRAESAELEAARRQHASLARRVEALGGAAPDAGSRAATELSGDLRGG